MDIEFIPVSVRPRRPWVTWGMVAGCVAWSITYQALSGSAEAEKHLFRFGFGSVETVGAGEVWRLLGNVFFNPSVLWLFVVGLSLLSIGPPVERFLGPLRFAGLIAGTTLAGALAALFVSRTYWTGMGSVLFGLLGATLGMRVQCRNSHDPETLSGTYRWFILWTAVNAALVGFLSPIVLIQYAAAAGAGILMGLAIPGASSERRPGWASAIVSGLLTAALLLSVAWSAVHVLSTP